MNAISLCAGYGGIELGLEQIIPGFQTVCYVEGETYAASNIVQKMGEGRIHQAPIWDDLRTFDGKPWSGKVDLISGGFPCQPFSIAGKQLGDKDPRHLWPFIVKIISQVRPKYLFFENVPGVVRWILSDILNDLTELGYNATWCVVGAGEVGAPHRRNRWFLLAEFCDPNGDGFNRTSKINGKKINGRGNVERNGFENNGDIDSNPKRRGFKEVQPSSSRRTWEYDSSRSRFVFSDSNDTSECAVKRAVFEKHGHDISGICSKVSDSNRQRSQRAVIPKRKKEGIWSDPSMFSQKRRIDRWEGKFNQWWKVEPSMGRLVDGTPDWVDKIRILGNGVVPQQAAYAFQILAARLAEGMVENRTPRD